MSNRFDYAQVYYWRIQFVEPEDPDDDRYVVLHGENGEVVGPMTMAVAQAWIQQIATRSVDEVQNEESFARSRRKMPLSE